MPEQEVRALMATVHLDQILYDKIVRKQEYTKSQIVHDYMEDFFVFSLGRRLEKMFIPLDHSKFPEQIGRAVSLATLKLNTMSSSAKSTANINQPASSSGTDNNDREVVP